MRGASRHGGRRWQYSEQESDVCLGVRSKHVCGACWTTQVMLHIPLVVQRTGLDTVGG